MTQSAEVGYRFDLDRLPHADAVPFADNSTIQEIVNAAVQMAREDLSNMVQTMGFVGPNGKALPLTRAYEQACDFAFQKVATGAQDYNSAIRQATKELANHGIVTIDYATGRTRTLEAAVRANVMGAMGTMQEKISQRNHDDFGCDGWEISAHVNSAPDHEPIQGKQYSDEEYTRLNNSLVRRIGTLNCGHAAFPIIMGVDSPQYTPEQLEKFRQENEKGFTYEGKHYTGYQATQRQRLLERHIRYRKRRCLIDEATGDKEQLAIDQTKLVRLNDEYARFTKAAGLRSQRERAQVAGFGRQQAADARNATASVMKMAQMNESENDWSDALSRIVSKEEKSRLIEYAANKGIKIPGLRNFDGDPDLLKASIDALSSVNQELPIKKSLILSVGSSLPDEDFGATVGNHITVNGKILRNRQVTEANLKAGGLFASSKVEDIVVHEYGHVIAAAKGNRGIEIARKACYNIYKRDFNVDEVLRYLDKEVSQYATTYYAKGKEKMFFDPKRYKEIIPEMLAKNNSEPSGFTSEFVKLLKEMLSNEEA